MSETITCPKCGVAVTLPENVHMHAWPCSCGHTIPLQVQAAAHSPLRLRSRTSPEAAPPGPPAPATPAVPAPEPVDKGSSLLNARAEALRHTPVIKSENRFLRWLRHLAVFLVSCAVVAGPILWLQHSAVQNSNLLHWHGFLMILFAMGLAGVLAVIALTDSFSQFLLVFCVPILAWAVVMLSPIKGFMILFASFLYTTYYVFFRMKSPAFKGIFAAYLLVRFVTAPLVLNQSEQYRKAQAVGANTVHSVQSLQAEAQRARGK